MKKIIISIFLISIALSSMVFAQGKDKKAMGNDKAVMIALVLDAGGKSKSAKRLFGAVSNGLKKAGVTKKIIVDFIKTADADKKMLAEYDAVVAINEGTDTSLSKKQTAFIVANKGQSNFYVVALLPKNSKAKTLKKLPKGVDVLAAPSTKAQATGLIAGMLSKKIAAGL